MKRTRTRQWLLLGTLTSASIALILAIQPCNSAQTAETETELTIAMGHYPPVSIQARWWLDGSYPLTVYTDHGCTIQAADTQEIHCWQDRHVPENLLEHLGPTDKVPTLKADAINGRAAVNFYHSVLKGDDRFGTELTQASIFLVFTEHERSPRGKSAYLMNLNGDSSANRFSLIGPHYDGLIYFDSGKYRNGSTEARSAAPARPIGEVTMVTAWKDSHRGQSGLQVNDGDAYCSTGNPPAEMVGGLRMGDYVEDTDVGELIVVANRLTDRGEQMIEDYLIKKWGISRVPRSDVPPDPGCYTPPVSP